MADKKVASSLINRRCLLAGAGAGAVVGAAVIAGNSLAAAAGAQPVSASSRIVPPAGKIPVAFLMDDGATMIDFAGPWEVFQDAGAAQVPGFHLFTVAPQTTVLQTTGNMENGPEGHKMSGLKFIADYAFEAAPQPRIIVIGAQIGWNMPAKLEWIRKAAASADVVMSVCTGAFILANTGLLEGRSATTHHEFYAQFEEQFPKISLVRDKRFVDNGKFVTAGGLTSGVDAALHIVDRYYGPEAAQKTADYMEHYGDGWRTGVPRRG